MDTKKSIIAACGWLMAGVALAHESGLDESVVSSTDSPDPETIIVLVADSPERRAAPRYISDAGIDLASSSPDGISSYRAIPLHSFLATAGVGSLATSAASFAFIQQNTGIDPRAMLSSGHWLSPRPGVAQALVIAHAWQDLTFEGTAFSSPDAERSPTRQEMRRIDSRSARLSFSPVSNWVVRLTRGTVSGLDQLVAREEVRRTAVSATYRYPLAAGDWEATFAWGRNSRKFRESTVGYLIESAYRYDGVHSLFGRVEQVGSDDIARQNESAQRQLFMMNKLTLGYSQDLRLTSSLRMDAGAYVTRHFVPSGMAASYGSGPTAYMMFMRLKFQ